ncbi:MAG: isocitrate/isopropylmalate family dehydrogenase, partial [Actinobacteria bacterium]|nr:isocitrate/isopropylmalate family dehydrogenase [Actinomycetota bacterium]
MKGKVLVLPGDGIGPEVVAEAAALLDRLPGVSLELTEEEIGGCSIDAHGTALREEVVAKARASDAVLLGAVGGPKWDDPQA